MLEPGVGFGLDPEATPIRWTGVLSGSDHLQRDEAISLELARPIDDAHAAVAEDAENLVARHLGVFAALAGRQVRRNGPRVARQLRRGAVGIGGSRKLIRRARLVHGTPRSDPGVPSTPVISPVRHRCQGRTSRTCLSLAALRLPMA